MPTYAYKALEPSGKVRQGEVTASDEAGAFARLRLDNLTPVTLKPLADVATSGPRFQLGASAGRMREVDTEALLSSLAVLLRAGADIRTALNVLSDGNPALRDVTQKILGGSSVEAGLTPLFSGVDAHLGALIAAGEIRGDLPSGLEAAASVITTRRKIRAQLVEALSYPVFVFFTAVAALFVILLVVVPAIAPLLSDTQQEMPIYFSLIVWMSNALQLSWPYILLGMLVAGVLFSIGYVFGGLKRQVQGWLIDGPLGFITGALIYGGYARTLGDILTRGAGLTDGLRLCQRSVGNEVARERLESVSVTVRQGRLLSEALRGVKGFPKAIVKLAEVGEASGALGPMLARAGEREEADGLLTITRLSKLLGPMLIVVLGAMIGLIMGGVLTALTDIGSIAGG